MDNFVANMDDFVATMGGHGHFMWQTWTILWQFQWENTDDISGRTQTISLANKDDFVANVDNFVACRGGHG